MTGLLPRATWRLLRRGAQPGRYASEFGAHVSLVRRLRCAGWTLVKIARELEDDANAGGDYYRGPLTSRHDGRRAFHKYIVAHCDRQDHDDRTSARRRDRDQLMHPR